jgi:ankyrin repeat protein
MVAAQQGQKACLKALLRAKADTELLDEDGRTALQWAEAKGHTATAQLLQEHAAPPQPAAAAPAAPPDAGEPEDSTPASLPLEIYETAWQGVLLKVVKWLRKGGLVDAFGSATTARGYPSTCALLHVAATNGQLELVRELLKRGASIDLPGGRGLTALMSAALNGHLSILLVLLQHSANPDLQDIDGGTALMKAACQGQEACVQTLLRARANKHRAAYQRRLRRRPAVRRGQGPHGCRKAHSAALSFSTNSPQMRVVTRQGSKS